MSPDNGESRPTEQGGPHNLEPDAQDAHQSTRPDGLAVGALRATLDEAMAEQGCSMKHLTVLSDPVDPFRIDTPANHRDGRWLAETMAGLGIAGRRLHLRGLHYAVLGSFKPDGTQYVNTTDNWLWIGGALKAARWLGYVPFDQIVDQRNAEPVVRIHQPSRPWPFVSSGVNVEIPDVDDMEPYVGLADFTPAQPYKLVMIGEKSSLDDVLGPVASRYKADLYLPTGNISDTLVHQIARIGAEDGRPMVVTYFADCDPSGWNMAIEVGRKLQAFKASLYPKLEFREYRAALTPDQVPTLGLPSTPLKDTERRADKWRAAWGVEQTEIDALATLQPDVLREIAKAALDPFYDPTLGSRAWGLAVEWRSEAQAIVDESVDLTALRDQMAVKLAELRDEIAAINNAARIDASDIDLPPVPDLPEPVIDEDTQPLPLVDSRWSFADQCQRLNDSKAYRP